MKPGVGRYAEQLRRLLTIAGEEPMELDEVLQGVFVLESDRPEWSFLRGERLSYGRAGIPAQGVDTKGAVALINPAGSGVLGVMTAVWMFNAAGSGVGAEFANLIDVAAFRATGTWAVGLTGFRDRRFTGVPTLTVERAAPLSAALAAMISLVAFIPASVTTAAQLSGMQFFDIVLPPGAAMLMHDPGTNQNVNGGYHWRERAIAKYERA